MHEIFRRMDLFNQCYIAFSLIIFMVLDVEERNTQEEIVRRCLVIV